MNKYIIILFCLITLQGYSKEKYTITQYKIDKILYDSAYTLVNNSQYEEADVILKQHKSKISIGKYYLQAKINYHLNKPFKSELNKAFALGFSFVDSSEFYLANQFFIDNGIQNELNNQDNNVAKQLFEELSTLDQKYLKEDGLFTGSKEHKTLLVKLDSLITIYGWPCKSEYHFKGLGPTILLAHQDFPSHQYFMKYYNQVVELCLDNKEDWMVADFILNQRYQWFGSTLRNPTITTDTLSLQIDKKGRLDKNYTLPLFYTMSNKLGVNSQYKLKMIVSKEWIKNEIHRLIYFFEEQMNPEVKLIFIKHGWPLQKKLTDDRFSIDVNPKLKDKELVYQFVN